MGKPPLMMGEGGRLARETASWDTGFTLHPSKDSRCDFSEVQGTRVDGI